MNLNIAGYTALILILLSGLARGTRDAIEFHTQKFHEVTNTKGSKFWNKTGLTYLNKYKDGTREPKFILSTTLFVSFTDSWHLLSMIERLLLLISFGLLFFISYEPTTSFFYKIIIAIIIASIYFVNSLGFYIAYKLIF